MEMCWVLGKERVGMLNGDLLGLDRLVALHNDRKNNTISTTNHQ